MLHSPNITKYINVNYIIDVPRLEQFFFNDYFSLKEVVSMYVTYLVGLHVSMSTSVDSELRTFTGPDQFVSLLQMEKQECNKFYDSISRNLINEKQAYEMIDYFNVFPKGEITEIFDTIHDNINSHIRNVVVKAIDDYDYYIGRIILIDTVLINQHTVVVSFKTINLVERLHDAKPNQHQSNC